MHGRLHDCPKLCAQVHELEDQMDALAEQHKHELSKARLFARDCVLTHRSMSWKNRIDALAEQHKHELSKQSMTVCP